MQKAVVFFLSLWYLLLSGGVVASTHMCQEMAQEMLLLGFPGEEGKVGANCCSENGSHSNDCCEYTEILVPSNKVQKFSQKELANKDSKASLQVNGTDFMDFQGASITETLVFQNEFYSRLESKVSLHILHCVYRI